MSKHIHTLVSDVYAVLDPARHTELDLDQAARMGATIAGHVANTLASKDKQREMGKYWASDLGAQCLRKLWYDLHMRDEKEPIAPHTFNKFLYGDVIEETLLGLCIAAGHTVTHQQHRFEKFYGKILDKDLRVSGKIDAIIDGQLVDVKSCSSFAFKKYKDAGYVLRMEDDSFDYLYQLSWYYRRALEEGLIKENSTAYFLMQDKQNGTVALVTPELIYDEQKIEQWVQSAALSSVESQPPERGYAPVPYQKSGNETINIACQYCPFKQECWTGLRTFKSYKGPVFLSKVVREPKMEEIT